MTTDDDVLARVVRTPEAPGDEVQADGATDPDLLGHEVLGQEEHLTRDERRRRTEAAILQASRELFAEAGFERTTIRGVAARAGVDPALVMQRYGSKEGLFAAAAHWSDAHSRILTATSDNLAGAGLADLFDKFEGSEPGDAEAAVALIRNCLTHPSAARVVRDEVMCDRAAAVAAALDGEDRELRAALFGACLIGLSMSRYLLEIEPLASASHEQVARWMEPVLRALVDPPGPPAAES